MGWKWLWDKRHRSWAFLTADPYLMFARPPCIFVCSFTGGWINEGGKACVTHTRRLQVLQYHQLGVQRWKQHAKNSHECLINRFYTTESDNSFDRKLSCLLAQSAYVFCSGVLLRELRPLRSNGSVRPRSEGKGAWMLTDRSPFQRGAWPWNRRQRGKHESCSRRTSATASHRRCVVGRKRVRTFERASVAC
eukprot:6212192-Pleurochrysis_carterae.AAC.1